MNPQMMRKHYLMFGLNMILSTIVMYLVMFEMIRGEGEFVQNINFFYMALTMAMPMGVLMLLMMGSMYADKGLNLILTSLLAPSSSWRSWRCVRRLWSVTGSSSVR